LSVGQFIIRHKPLVVLHPGDRLETVLARLTGETHTTLPVIDSDGRLLGVIGIEEVFLAAQTASLSAMILADDLMRSDIVPLQTEQTLDRALEMFVENDLLELPVVDGPAQRVIGLVSRAEISKAYLRRVQGTSETLRN
jgi:Mg/Co/Ni transporter MgtE